MSPKTAAAERRVVDTAKQIGLALQYGVNPAAANREYTRARDAQARARQEERA